MSVCMIDYTSYIGRPHPGRRTERLPLSAKERKRVEAALKPATAEKRIVLRAQALLMLVDGVAAMDVATLLGVNQRTVRRWRERFATSAPASRLADNPRSGRPPSLSRTRTPRGSRPKPVANLST